MDNADRYIWPVFWTAAVAFVLAVAGILFKSPLQAAMPMLLVILILDGVALLVLAIRSGKEKKLKLFLALTGAALAAMPVFILLHNLTYALLVQASQYGIMTFKGNEDEPVFFILALVVCPVVYLVGAVASVFLLVKSRRGAKQA